MKSYRVVTDMDECGRLWNQIIPREQLSALWDVRQCFQNQYGHKPYFIVCEDHGEICGFLPLSRNEETGSYLYFPGETWEAKTWLEQNRLIVRDNSVLKEMLNLIPGKYYLRYLQPTEGDIISNPLVDEIGYFFLPPVYDYNMDSYFKEFSGKSAKRLRREMESFEARGVEIAHDIEDNFEIMAAMNLQRYGSMSYFHDTRFLNSFRNLFQLHADNGWLRMTTVRIEGQVAAVDMGSVYNNTYTLLAGGTNADFPGVAKLINLYHMRWACEQRIERVDFLCGDFNWKTQFHLAPRPLYQLSGEGRIADRREVSVIRHWDPPQAELAAGV